MGVVNMVQKFDDFRNEGAAYATLGNTGGMGSVVSSQPGALGADFMSPSCSSRGSGDIGSRPFSPATAPGTRTPRKKRKSKKRKSRRNESVAQEVLGFSDFISESELYGNMIDPPYSPEECVEDEVEVEGMPWEKTGHVSMFHWGRPEPREPERFYKNYFPGEIPEETPKKKGKK